MEKFIAEFGEDKLDWLFEEEVMPVCKEVVIPMKRQGAFIDVPYFTTLQKQAEVKLNSLEDEIIQIIEPYLGDFSKGDSLEEAVSQQRIVKKIIELEGLSIP
jgi:DNA polymerase I-like protein with 3'-5' exonuclease and polymerase domains